VLLVEQHVTAVLKVADYVYVMNQGRVVYGATAQEARANLSVIEETYLGGSMA
jgi:ABC-type branched-subunit amino acid transport system ATPase component